MSSSVIVLEKDKICLNEDEESTTTTTRRPAHEFPAVMWPRRAAACRTHSMTPVRSLHKHFLRQDDRPWSSQPSRHTAACWNQHVSEVQKYVSPTECGLVNQIYLSFRFFSCVKQIDQIKFAALHVLKKKKKKVKYKT